MYLAVVLAIASIVTWPFLRRMVSPSSPSLKIPPGPRPKWIIGNLLDIPTKAGWIAYTEWKKRYGDIVCLRAFGNTLIVLNSLDTVKDLLERRGNIYSDRVALPMIGEMMGLNQSIPLIQYGNTWRKHRRLTTKHLSHEAVKKYYALQDQFAVMFLHSLLNSPEEFVEQLRLTAGRIVMAVTYGLSVNTPDSEYITELEEIHSLIDHATTPGAYLVDLLPALKHVPACCPFASFKRIAAYGHRQIARVVSRPFEYVKAEMAAGRATPSFTSELLKEMLSKNDKLDLETEDLIRWSAGSMYGAGGETTYATLLCFILAMVLYPEVQRKAQAEIDNALGSERLPNIHDRPSLPYVVALIKETMRWGVILPLGLAHSTTTDDVYNGYFVPAGSVIVPNVWAIAHDEANFESPQDFRPERFLGSAGGTVDSDAFAFGFGRRICPGRHLGENSVFIIISYLLSAFNISKELDSRGYEIPLDVEFTTGLFRYPKPFKCHIEPRSAVKSRAIREMEGKLSGKKD